MFSRRSHRHSRGRAARSPIVSVAPPTTPLTIWGANVRVWLKGDLGSNTTALWQDQSGNGFHFTGTGTGVTLTATDATLNNLPTFTGDGAAGELANAALDLPAPATTPTTIVAVFKVITWVGADVVWGNNNTVMSLQMGGASPNLNMRNTTAVNGSTGAAVGSWARACVSYTGSTSDSSKIGSAAAVTGASAGNTDAVAGFGIMARPGGSWANVAFHEFVLLDVVPTAPQLADYDSYVTSYSGGVVLV